MLNLRNSQRRLSWIGDNYFRTLLKQRAYKNAVDWIKAETESQLEGSKVIEHLCYEVGNYQLRMDWFLKIWNSIMAQVQDTDNVIEHLACL